MGLEGLFPLLSSTYEYRGLLEQVRQGEAAARAILPEPALPYCVGALRKDIKAPILVLVARPERARLLYSWPVVGEPW